MSHALHAQLLTGARAHPPTLRSPRYAAYISARAVFSFKMGSIILLLACLMKSAIYLELLSIPMHARLMKSANLFVCCLACFRFALLCLFRLTLARVDCVRCRTRLAPKWPSPIAPLWRRRWCGGQPFCSNKSSRISCAKLQRQQLF